MHPPIARAFTLIEAMIVVTVIGILAAIVVPQMAAAGEHAKSAAVQAAVGSVRSGIAAYRTRAIIAGDAPYPTAAQLRTPGVVMSEDLPINPYNGLRTVQDVTQATATARTISNTTAFGWNYFMSNTADPATAIFYCNTSDDTEVPNGTGGLKKANQL
ncbi:MAG: type II secretion system protein [Phycisphaerales bacterium]|nr:type II secretion system protein [Phycisphaerales bacterium]